MKLFITSFFFLLFINFGYSQEIYSKTYGNSENPSILFLHGGPGFNSLNFEITTAEKLAESGYFVIIYDRRGEGRSANEKADYTFKQTLQDLNSIIDKYKIEKVNIIGHSFGGIVATYYAKNNPEKVNSIIYLSTPISFQNILKSTLESVKKIYVEKNDLVNLNYVKMIENMNANSLEYSSYILMHAMANKFYTPKETSESANYLRKELTNDSVYQKYNKIYDYQSPLGFWNNEKYTTIDLSEDILKLNKTIRIYGIYGKDDGIIPDNEVDKLSKIITTENIKYLENCSHNIFIDQQELFISQIKNLLN